MVEDDGGTILCICLFICLFKFRYTTNNDWGSVNNWRLGLKLRKAVLLTVLTRLKSWCQQQCFNKQYIGFIDWLILCSWNVNIFTFFYVSCFLSFSQFDFNKKVLKCASVLKGASISTKNDTREFWNFENLVPFFFFKVYFYSFLGVFIKYTWKYHWILWKISRI